MSNKHTKNDEPQTWTNVRGIAAHTGLSVDFFNKDRCTQLIGIPFTRVGKRILYHIPTVDAFLKGLTPPTSTT